MSNILLNQAWSVTVSSPTAKLVLVRLADRADVEGICWPMQATIQAETQLSESTVRRALGELIRDGHVSVVHRSRRPGVGKGASLYRVHPELLQAPTPVTVTGQNGSTPVSLTGVERPTPVTVTGQTPPTPVTVTGVENPTPVTVTADTGHSDRSSRENPQEPTSTSIASSSSPRPGVVVVEDDSRSSRLAEIEAVWTLWPKRVSELAAKVEIGHALVRDGARVLAGTAAIAAADRLRNPTVSPPGRYLPDPVRFFADSRYLDDPAQYGPRVAGSQDSASDPGEARRRLAELRTLLAEHPGNPENAVGSFDRKARSRPAFDCLKAEAEKLRRLLFLPDDHD